MLWKVSEQQKAYSDIYSLILDTKDNDFTIPADKEWHKITLDLTKLNFRGNECGIVYGNEKLDEIKTRIL